MPTKIWPVLPGTPKNLSRRISTASSIKYPMHLISYSNLMDLCDDDDEVITMKAHQFLQEGSYLVRWEEIKDEENAFIVFVSHEWLGWKHADPNGQQLRVLCKVLKRLATGKVKKVQYPAFERVVLGQENHVVRAREWKKLLSNAYFWIDWMSMPQPGAEIEDDDKELSRGEMPSSVGSFIMRKSSKDASFRVEPLTDAELKVLEFESKNAIASIPAYVERSDLVLVLAPGCRHCDRTNEATGKLVRTCYRSWRSRGWCVLEYLATFLSRDKQLPMMVVTSAKCTPYFTPLMDVLKLTIAKSKFTCCQRNHNFTDSRGQVVGCDKFVCGQILAPMLRSKIAFLYATGKYSQARLLDGTRRHILGGLGQDSETVLMSKVMKDASAFETTENYEDAVLREFKKTLQWRDRVDGRYLDAEKLPLLIVAVLRCDVIATRAIIRSIHTDRTLTLQERNDCLHCTLPDEAGKVVHVPKGLNALECAMSFGTPDVVTELLKSGMDPFRSRSSLADAVMLSCACGNVRLLRAWLDRFPDWDMSRRNSLLGATVLHLAVYYGVGQIPMVNFLLKHYGDKVDVCSVNDTGGSILANACESEDSDPEVVLRIIGELRARDEDGTRLREMVNRKRRATWKWRMIYALGKFLHASFISRRGMLWQIGQDQGNTPLHAAVVRGDAEIVEILLEAGADHKIQDNNGHTPADLARLKGPFPSLVRLLHHHASSAVHSSGLSRLYSTD